MVSVDSIYCRSCHSLYSHVSQSRSLYNNVGIGGFKMANFHNSRENSRSTSKFLCKQKRINILEKIRKLLNRWIKYMYICNMCDYQPERSNDDKINLVNIFCILFLLTILYVNMNNHISYQFLESNSVQKLFSIYSNYLKAGSLMINTTPPETRSSLSINDIKNLVSTGEIDSNNTESNLLNQSIYPNNFYFGKSSSQYMFSSNRSEINTPQNNSHTLEFENSRIALVKPTFTDAAYHRSFYEFYRMYDQVPIDANVTSNLTLLSSKISTNQEGAISNVFAMLDLVKNLKWLTNDSNITILSDQDFDSKSIFDKNGSNLYDVIILGHQEYVTQEEYNGLKEFVSNGGTIILLDGNVFYAQVKYDSNTNLITLVKGHGWAFNGKSAWKSVDERWKNETSKWIGSNYLCAICHISYVNNPFGYIHHEEQYVTNPKDIILLSYPFANLDPNISKKMVVATYELNYNKGKVIALGLYSDDIINNGVFDRFFDSLLVKYALRNSYT